MDGTHDFALEKVPLVEGPSSEILLPPELRKLGAVDRAQVTASSIDIDDLLSISVANPFAVRLADLYLNGHGQVPDAELFRIYSEYDLWLIIHAMGAIRRAGGVRLKRLGYCVELGDFDDVESGLATCSLFPETRVLNGPEIDVALGVEGNFDIIGAAGGLMGRVLSLVPGVKLALSNDLKITGALRFQLRSHIATTTGFGRPLAEWAFSDAEGPLFGDHLMVQTIRVPHGYGPVSLSARVYAQVADWYEWTLCPRLVWSERRVVELRL